MKIDYFQLTVYYNKNSFKKQNSGENLLKIKNLSQYLWPKIQNQNINLYSIIVRERISEKVVTVENKCIRLNFSDLTVCC